MYSEVTFWRPKIGTSIKRKGEDLGAVTTPVTAPVTAPNGGLKMQDKVFRIIKSSPTISKAEIGRLCGLT
jgi:hypothetical protein